MRHIPRLAALLSAITLAVLGAAGTAMAAPAVPHPTIPAVVHSDKTGIAGYYVNEGGGWRFRDVRVSFTVTAEMEQLNNLSTIGAPGVRQCDPNTDYSVQSGLIWTGSIFEAAYATGTLSGPGDPCVTGGLLPVTEFAGNINHLNTAIGVGDTLTFEQYYDPATHWMTLRATDVTQDVSSAHVFYAGWRNFYEAGVGLADAGFAQLVSPLSNLVSDYSGARVTPYSARASSTSLVGPWDLQEVTGSNLSNVTVLQPSPLTAGGSAFSIEAGVSI